MLGFTATMMESYAMTLTRNCFLPLVITRGSDQVPISSRFEVRNEPAVVRNFGTILIEYCKAVPDGIVGFFPSYLYMESIVAAWNEMVSWPTLLDSGRPSASLTTLPIHHLGHPQRCMEAQAYLCGDSRCRRNFSSTRELSEGECEGTFYIEQRAQFFLQACNNGRGAVLLSVARGKVSEGIDFDHNYGRAVIMFGIPYQYTESRILKVRPSTYLHSRIAVTDVVSSLLRV